MKIASQRTKRTIYPGGGKRARVLHEARFGRLEASGDSPQEAEAQLAAQLATLASDQIDPVILFDWGEPNTVWIAYLTEHGWGYRIDRSRAPEFSGCGVGCSAGGSWTRDECLERMRDHWAQNNVMDLVRGIVGLCTDLREWVCAHCHAPTRGAAPYVCKNPACGRARE
jgi:hypothetical protein